MMQTVNTSTKDKSADIRSVYDVGIYERKEFGTIRTMTIDGEPWFVANDVAKSLGYANPSDATNKHCKRYEMRWGSDSLGRRTEFKVIPESDLYRLIAKSQLPEAEKFESWIFDEVLPSIRKNGGYIANSIRHGVLRNAYSEISTHGNMGAFLMPKNKGRWWCVWRTVDSYLKSENGNFRKK